MRFHLAETLNNTELGVLFHIILQLIGDLIKINFHRVSVALKFSFTPFFTWYFTYFILASFFSHGISHNCYFHIFFTGETVCVPFFILRKGPQRANLEEKRN